MKGFSRLFTAWRTRFAVSALLLTLMGCSEIDCPLNNTVYTTYNFYTSGTTTAFSLTDTLTVSAMGTDSILYNKGIGVSSITLPVSYTGVADTLLFNWSNADGVSATDTLVVAHSNRIHFESLDCTTVVFHTITGLNLSVGATTDTGVLRIDSVILTYPEVTYDKVENCKVYVSTR